MESLHPRPPVPSPGPTDPPSGRALPPKQPGAARWRRPPPGGSIPDSWPASQAPRRLPPQFGLPERPGLPVRKVEAAATGRVSWRARGSVGLGVPPPAGYPGPAKLRLQVPAGCAIGCGVARVLCGPGGARLQVPADHAVGRAVERHIHTTDWIGTLNWVLARLTHQVRPRGVPGKARAQLP